jgi:DNA-binding MarR family transcriptional regulator
MEFFLLSLVSHGGLRTTYDLQRLAGLEPGGIRPALRRLEEQELLIRSKEARRRRRLIEVTEKGRLLLDRNWARCLQPYPDAESILRAAGLTVLVGRPTDARRYLMDMANECERKAGQEQANLLRPKSAGPLEWYQFMRALWQHRRSQSAAQVFRDVARELEELLRSH